jgi:hypothetical protein
VILGGECFCASCGFLWLRNSLRLGGENIRVLREIRGQKNSESFAFFAPFAAKEILLGALPAP